MDDTEHEECALIFIPHWRCSSCGRRYTGLESKCLVCSPKERKPSRTIYQKYIDIPTHNPYREYYEHSIDIGY